MQQVDICIVNWNSGNHLRSCIASIDQFGGKHVASTTLVDNASSDDSLNNCIRVDNLVVIKATGNMGFAKACNKGARVGCAEYILFLNPDSQLAPGAIDEAIAAMERPDFGDVGICGVRLLAEDGSTQRHCCRFPTPMSFARHSFGLSAIWPERFPSHVMSEFDHQSTQIVDHVIGAFFFVRRSVFAQLKGFDENYFVYLEDIDFSRRAKNAGWRCIYLADTFAHHVGGGSSSQVKVKRLVYSLTSRVIYSKKHFTTPSMAAVLLLTVVVEPLTRLGYSLLKGRAQEAVFTLGAYFIFVATLPLTLRKRTSSPN